jgi:hypothetical protein
MKPVQGSSQAMVMEQSEKISTSIYTRVPLNDSPLNIVQREFEGFLQGSKDMKIA